MEIFYASKNLHKFVVTMCPSERPSPWLTYWSSKVVKGLPEAIAPIVERIKRGDGLYRQWFIYLAGPINGCTDAQCNDWRAEARRLILEAL